MPRQKPPPLAPWPSELLPSRPFATSLNLSATRRERRSKKFFLAEFWNFTVSRVWNAVTVFGGTLSLCLIVAKPQPLRIVRPGLVLRSSRARHEQRRQNTHHHIPPRLRVACPMTRVQMAIQMVGATSHFIGFALQLRVQNRMGWSVLATGPVSECCRFATPKLFAMPSPIVA